MSLQFKPEDDFKIDNISFAVPEGSVCGFIGQNGAGKTTTIKAILDVINVDAGEIFVFGQDVKIDSARLREDIGVVFDEMGFHEFMTGKDINIMMKNIYKKEKPFIYATLENTTPENAKWCVENLKKQYDAITL